MFFPYGPLTSPLVLSPFYYLNFLFPFQSLSFLSPFCFVVSSIPSLSTSRPPSLPPHIFHLIVFVLSTILIFFNVSFSSIYFSSFPLFHLPFLLLFFFFLFYSSLTGPLNFPLVLSPKVCSPLSSSFLPPFLSSL